MVPHPPKVCMITSVFYPAYSGAARQALLLSQWLEKKGWKVFVLTSGSPEMRREEVVEGIPVFRVIARSRLRKIKVLSFSLGVILYLLKKRKEYDIIHLPGIFGWVSLSALLMGKLLGKRCIAKISAWGYDDPLSMKRSKLGAIKLRIFSLADFFIVTHNRLVVLFDNASLPRCPRIKVIPNGVDTQRFQPAKNAQEKALIRKRLNLPVQGEIAVFVGSMVKRKGLDLLVDMWPGVLREIPGATLVLVGPLTRKYAGSLGGLDPGFIKNIRKKIREYGMEERVIFTGEVSSPEDYLKSADVFVFPSRSEGGCPNALIQAMSCKLPCVVLKARGVSGVITEGEDGLVLPREEAQDFTRAVLRLFKEPAWARELGRKAREKVLSQYSIEKISREYEKLYRSLLEE